MGERSDEILTTAYRDRTGHGEKEGRRTAIALNTTARHDAEDAGVRRQRWHHSYDNASTSVLFIFILSTSTHGTPF
ncbi:hypothetical protein HYQ46_003844 [Verticillium longisporum]|nr:hypothetical protein HYQ46_003844 [Verticillium longisporum]